VSSYIMKGDFFVFFYCTISNIEDYNEVGVFSLFDNIPVLTLTKWWKCSIGVNRVCVCIKWLLIFSLFDIAQPFDFKELMECLFKEKIHPKWWRN
jgi:hypothetical protein